MFAQIRKLNRLELVTFFCSRLLKNNKTIASASKYSMIYYNSTEKKAKIVFYHYANVCNRQKKARLLNNIFQ